MVMREEKELEYFVPRKLRGTHVNHVSSSLLPPRQALHALKKPSQAVATSSSTNAAASQRSSSITSSSSAPVEPPRKPVDKENVKQLRVPLKQIQLREEEEEEEEEMEELPSSSEEEEEDDDCQLVDMSDHNSEQ